MSVDKSDHHKWSSSTAENILKIGPLQPDQICLVPQLICVVLTNTILFVLPLRKLSHLYISTLGKILYFSVGKITKDQRSFEEMAVKSAGDDGVDG
jgi:hypothetical protein